MRVKSRRAGLRLYPLSTGSVRPEQHADAQLFRLLCGWLASFFRLQIRLKRTHHALPVVLACILYQSVSSFLSCEHQDFCWRHARRRGRAKIGCHARQSLRSARGRCAKGGCLWVPALSYGSLYGGAARPCWGLCRAYGAGRIYGVRAAPGTVIMPPQQAAWSPMPFAFLPRSVQRRRLKQFRLINAAAAAKKEAESRVWFSPFVQLAKAVHPNPLVYEPRVSAAVFRWQMPCGDDVSWPL